MANSKVSALTALSSPTDDDLMYIVDTPGSTPVSKKISFGNLRTNLVSLTGTEVLTNKDLSSATNTLSTSVVTLTGTQTLTNKTLTSPKINENVAVTSTATEINVLHGIPAGLTSTELGYVDGVTSAIQTQLNTKSPSVSPSFTTPTLGVATATSINGLTLPAVADTVAVLGTAQTFTATQTEKQINYTNNAITAVANAATVPITYRLNTVTNNSAATLTITLTTASAVDGQISIVRVLDFSAAAQTITWVNTENSTFIVPPTSNGSTTLFLTAAFMFNGGTSKWRCLGWA